MINVMYVKIDKYIHPPNIKYFMFAGPGKKKLFFKRFFFILLPFKNNNRWKYPNIVFRLNLLGTLWKLATVESKNIFRVILYLFD